VRRCAFLRRFSRCRLSPAFRSRSGVNLDMNRDCRLQTGWCPQPLFQGQHSKEQPVATVPGGNASAASRNIAPRRANLLLELSVIIPDLAFSHASRNIPSTLFLSVQYWALKTKNRT
jgi:hypothetical protein